MTLVCAPPVYSILVSPEAEFKEKHSVWDPMPELTSPYVHSRVDSNTFTMGIHMPESTLTLFQSRLHPPVRDFEFGLWHGALHAWRIKRKFTFMRNADVSAISAEFSITELFIQFRELHLWHTSPVFIFQVVQYPKHILGQSLLKTS